MIARLSNNLKFIITRLNFSRTNFNCVAGEAFAKLMFVAGFSAILVCASNGAALASTFVGNAGSRGDVERAVTLHQLADTYTLMESDPAADLCRCNESFANHPMCAPLSALTEEQEKFCSATLSSQLAGNAKLVTSGKIHWEWSEGDMNVMENGRARSAEAVANYDEQTITIDQSKFTAMLPFDRMFLLQHELTHFNSINGIRMTDEGPIGPFLGKSGSRQLIDAMAAATVMRGVEIHIDDQYRKQLRRSQGWKKNWVGLRIGGVAANPSNTEYSPSTLSSTTIDYRRYFTSWGTVVGLRQSNGQRSVLGSATADETRSTFLLGGTYRIFPNQNPLSYWGQTHIVINALLEVVSSRYKLFDDYIGQSKKSTTLGGTIEASYTLPLFWGIWGIAGVGLEYAPSRFVLDSTSQVSTKLENNGIQSSAWLGVTYGF